MIYLRDTKNIVRDGYGKQQVPKETDDEAGLTRTKITKDKKCIEETEDEGESKWWDAGTWTAMPLPLNRLLIFIVGPLLIMSNILHLMRIILHKKLDICAVCPKPDHSVLKLNLLLTTWCLWTSTTTFFLWAIQCYKPHPSLQKWARRSFSVSFCWALVVSVSYLYYLYQSGNHFDKDKCYILWQQAFPKYDGDSRTEAYVYMVFANISTVNKHFISSIWHIILYMYNEIPYDQLFPPTGLIFFVLDGVVVGILQSIGIEMYCIKRVWPMLVLSWILFFILHVLLYFGHKRRIIGGSRQASESQYPTTVLQESITIETAVPVDTAVRGEINKKVRSKVDGIKGMHEN